MSKVSRWSYRNTATVKPFVSEDTYAGTIIYGDEYTIACTWAAESKEMRDANKDKKQLAEANKEAK